MSAIDIKGRDLGSATGGTLPVSFSPINLGIGAGAGASASSGTIGAGAGLSPLAIVAALILVIAGVYLMR